MKPENFEKLKNALNYAKIMYLFGFAIIVVLFLSKDHMGAVTTIMLTSGIVTLHKIINTVLKSEES